MSEGSLARSGLRSKGKALVLASVLTVLTLGLTPEVAAVEQVQDPSYPPCAQVVDEPTDGNCRAYEQAVRFSELPDEVRWEHQDQLPATPEGWLWAEDLTLVPASYYAGGQ